MENTVFWTDDASYIRYQSEDRAELAASACDRADSLARAAVIGDMGETAWRFEAPARVVASLLAALDPRISF